MLGKIFNLLAFCLVGWLGLAHGQSAVSMDWVKEYVANAIKPPTIKPPIPKYTIGQYAEGGVVFWLDSTGQHGLVCSIEDMDSGLQPLWANSSNQNNFANATSNGLVLGCDSAGKITTPGKINTNLIVAQNGPYDSSSNQYAAGACAAYRGGGYDDWYLPSLDELGLIQAMISIINTTSTGHGGSGLQNDVYWSSFEYDNNIAWDQNFYFGPQSADPKHVTWIVRAVRAF